MLSGFFIVVGIIAVVGGVAAAFIEEKWGLLALAVIGLVSIIMGASITYVPAGHAGVLIRAGSPTEKPIEAGKVNWHVPIVESVHETNCKRQERSFDDTVFGCETSTPTVINLSDVSVTYSIVADKVGWIWMNIDSFDTDLVREKQVSSGLKEATKRFGDMEVTTRSMIQPLAADIIQRELDDYYGEHIIDIHAVTIGDMSFNPEYEALLEEAAKEKKELEKADIKIERERKEAEAEKQKAIIKAEQDAETTRIRAEAEAKANEILTKSIDDKMLKQQWIEKWDGKTPQVVGGNGSLFYGLNDIED